MTFVIRVGPIPSTQSQWVLDLVLIPKRFLKLLERIFSLSNKSWIYQRDLVQGIWPMFLVLGSVHNAMTLGIAVVMLPFSTATGPHTWVWDAISSAALTHSQETLPNHRHYIRFRSFDRSTLLVLTTFAFGHLCSTVVIRLKPLLPIDGLPSFKTFRLTRGDIRVI